MHRKKNEITSSQLLNNKILMIAITFSATNRKLFKNSFKLIAYSAI